MTQKLVTSDKDQEILRMVKSIRYGVVSVVVHNREVVQIECTEKIRFEKENLIKEKNEQTTVTKQQ